MRISDWSSDVCSSDLNRHGNGRAGAQPDRDRDSRRHAARRVHPLFRAAGRHRHRPADGVRDADALGFRSEEHTSELQSLMRISYAVFCLKKKKNTHPSTTELTNTTCGTTNNNYARVEVSHKSRR